MNCIGMPHNPKYIYTLLLFAEINSLQNQFEYLALYIHLLVDSILRPLTVLLRNVNWFLIFLRYVWMTTQAFIMRAFDLSVVHENIMRIVAQISCELLTLWLWNITITILHFLIYRNNNVFVVLQIHLAFMFC